MMMNLKHSYLHPLLNGLIILLVLWLAGFVLFARDVSHVAIGDINDTTLRADGLVVLTGGSERVEAGLDLLLKKTAPLLLISGVDERAKTEKIVPDHHPAAALKTCCITFGTYAEDTYGNAVEAAAWAKKHAMKKIIIVTAHYHMRRSLVVFRQLLNDVVIEGFAVEPENVRLNAWWNYSGTASLLISEYMKLLLAYGRRVLS